MAPPTHLNTEASTDSLQPYTAEGFPAHRPSSLSESVNDADVSMKMLAAGGLAGACSKSVTAPFARLTILYQVGAFKAIGGTPRLDYAVSHVIRTEGFLSLWKGNLATIMHRVPYSAASFMIYEQALTLLQRALPKEKKVISGKVDVMRRFLAGAAAGSLSTVCAYPIDLVRTRLAAQTSRDYKGIWDVLRKTWLEESGWGLYKGLGGSLLQVVPCISVNLSAYETMRSYWIAHFSQNNSPGFVGSVVCGGTSGFISSTLTYPIDLIRRRMQLQGLHGRPRTYATYADAIRDTWRTGRFRSFYVGIAAEYFKVIPGVAIIYSVYEFSKQSLGVDGYNAGRR